ncbi:MAG: 16S rRNA (uracil(1498)-N(3))-methyltransferase [Candidatus Bostrichicola ureolyticus]|nr:MAG: 16S rRNA (uracil(1498)-N(3))-methyltransferase [Candidatus Bostrichicola ureolyticus]
MKLFFLEKKNDSMIELNKQDSYHINTVLRMHPGKEIFVTNGYGDLWKAIIHSIINGIVKAKPIMHYPEYNKKKYWVHIGISLIKSIDRFEWFLEKATELGVDEVTPLICKNSERKKINIIRGIKIIRSAAKQSFRTYIPIINNVSMFNTFISSMNNYNSKFIAHCNTNFNRKVFNEVIQNTKKYIILIGPEGDFSSEEINQALNFNWNSISLGNIRLRVETAGLVALHTLLLKYNS